MSRSPCPLSLQVLHVDDDEFERATVAEALAQVSSSTHRFLARSASDLSSFWTLARELPPEVVLMDINLSQDPQEGLGVVPAIREAFPEAVVIMRSSSDDAATVHRSICLGADDFLSKRMGDAELGFRIAAAHQLAALKRGAVPQSVVTGIGARKAPRAIGETLGRIAQQMSRLVHSAVSAVHVIGESGTGKELVADVLESELKGQTVLRVNCGALSPTLLESQLFGHAKGAFTGAVTEKAGLIEAASGGWLFLDEVATLSSSAQVALLRALENGEVTRVGESAPRSVRVRVISACNEPLDKLVAEGRFRKDLWQRLREVEIRLPPLRERREEIPGLIAHFCATMEGGPYILAPEALEVLVALPWREGNIRELRNCLRAMTVLSVQRSLTLGAIPQYVWASFSRLHGEVAPSSGSEESLPLPSEVSNASPTDFDALAEKLFASLVKTYLRHERDSHSLKTLARALSLSPHRTKIQLEGALQRRLLDAEDLKRLQ